MSKTIYWKGFVTVYDVGEAKIVPASEEIPLDPVFPLIHHFVQDPSDEKWYLVVPHVRETVIAFRFGMFWGAIDKLQSSAPSAIKEKWKK